MSDVEDNLPAAPDVKDEVPDMPDIGSLSPKQRTAAYLEARGLSIIQIADALGMSRPTISAWRMKSNPSHEEYFKLVEYWTNLELSRLDRLYEATRIRLLEAGWKGVEKLLELVEAEDEEGRPKLTIQLDASKELAKLIALAAPKVDTKDGGGSSATAAVIIVQRPDRLDRIEDAATVIEAKSRRT